MRPVSLEEGPGVFVLANASRNYLLTLCHADGLQALGYQTLRRRQQPQHYAKLLQALGVLAGPSTGALMLEDDKEEDWPELADPPALMDADAVEDGAMNEEDDVNLEELPIVPRAPVDDGPVEYPLQWGPYRFTKKRSSWQVERPFHKRNEGSYSRKLMALQVGDGLSIGEAERRCIMRRRRWAVIHSQCSRQWRRIIFHPEYDECPDNELLELQKGSEADRPTIVRTDDELDAEEVARTRANYRRRRR